MKEYTDAQKALLLASTEQSLKKRCEMTCDASAYFSDSSGADKLISRMEKEGISVVTAADKEYPECLN